MIDDWVNRSKGGSLIFWLHLPTVATNSQALDDIVKRRRDEADTFLL